MANQEIEGLSVRADMEGSSLKQGLQALNAQLKSVKSEFTLAQAGVSGFSESLEGMRAKSENLGKQINIQSQIVENLRQAYERSQTAVNTTITKQAELRDAMASNRSQYEEAIRLHGEESEEATNLATAYQRLERQYNQNQTALNRNNTALANAQTRFNNAQASLRSMETELRDTDSAIQRQSSNWQQLANTLGDISGRLTKAGEKLSDFGDKMTKGVTAPIAALGTASTIASMTYEDAMAKMQAQTGAAAAEMEGFKHIVQNLYDNNMGEGFADLAISVAEVNKQTKLSGDALQSFTSNALALRDTFEYGVVESTKTANMMMQQFGVTSEQAFDLLAKASQNGLDKNGNLLDTINEYSVHFKQLGVDVDEMFNMLSNGAATGVFDVDKLGDSIKEFGIRAKDGSKTTVEAFGLLNLDATEMQKAFANGGESAQKAFRQVVKSIQECNDEVTLNTVGVNLFGTMWEDVGGSAVKALADAKGEFSNLSGTMTGINNALYSTSSQSFESLKREYTEIAASLGESLLPLLKDGAGVLKEWSSGLKNMDDDTKKMIVTGAGVLAVLGPVTSGIGRMVTLGSKLASGISGLSSKIAGAGGLKAALMAIPTPASAAVLGITAIVGVLALWKKSADEAREAQERALEQARTYTETAKSMDELKEKYREVNELQDDDKTKKEQLKSIQDELISTYGLEASGIDIVNGKYSDQIELLNKLKDSKRQGAEQAYKQNLHDTEEKLNNAVSNQFFTRTERSNKKEFDQAIKDIQSEMGNVVYKDWNGWLHFDVENEEEYMKVLDKLILRLNDYGVYSGGLYNDIKKQYDNLSTSAEEYAKAQEEAYTFDFSNQLQDITKNLGLDGVAEYTEEQAERIKVAFTDSMQSSDTEYKTFADNMLKSLPIVGKAMTDNLANKDTTTATEELAESLYMLTESIEGAGKITDTFASDLSTLEKAIEKVKDGGKLSGEEIVALKEKYSDLNVKINESTGERYIELSALEKLREELPNLSKAQIESEKARTETAIKSAKERMKIYLEEQKVLQGLVSYNSQSGNLDWGNMPNNVRDNILNSNPQIQEQYDQAMAEAQKVKDLEKSLAEFDKALNNIDTINTTRGNNSGSSGGKDSALDKALESFEKSKKVREIGLNEEMDQLEKIKSAYASTAEEKVQIEEYMYNNYLDIIERKRSLGQLSNDEEVRMYQEALDKYTFDEYQKAEISSKLLDTKIEHSKEWIETEKYYGRLSLEEEKKAYERIAEYSKESAEYKKEMAKEIYRVEKELKEQQEELEKEKQEAVKKTVEANIKAKEEEYNKTIAMIDEECNRKVEAYQAQIDALQEQYDKEEELQKQQEYDEKIADLEQRMKNARTQEEFEKLAEELNDTQQAKRDYTRQQQLKSDKELLQDKIDQAKNEADIAKGIEKEKLDAYKETQNKMLEESTTIETSITEALKQQLSERETAFVASLQVMLTAYAGFKASLGGIGGLVGIGSGISGITLAAASSKLQATPANNNYNSPSYNNTNNNASMQITNIVKNSTDISKIMSQLTSFMQQLNRAKGV